MSIIATLEKYTDSDIYRLVYDGKAVGLRIRLYSRTSDSYVYYDFRPDLVRNDPFVVKFIEDNFSSLESVSLEVLGGKLVSKEEYTNNYEVAEITDETLAIARIKDVIRYRSLRRVSQEVENV